MRESFSEFCDQYCEHMNIEYAWLSKRDLDYLFKHFDSGDQYYDIGWLPPLAIVSPEQGWLQFMDMNKTIVWNNIHSDIGDYWDTIRFRGKEYDINYDEEYNSTALYEIIDGKADTKNPIKVETIKQHITEDGHTKTDCPICDMSEHIDIITEHGKCEQCQLEYDTKRRRENNREGYTE